MLKFVDSFMTEFSRMKLFFTGLHNLVKEIIAIIVDNTEIYDCNLMISWVYWLGYKEDAQITDHFVLISQISK